MRLDETLLGERGGGIVEVRLDHVDRARRLAVREGVDQNGGLVPVLQGEGQIEAPNAEVRHPHR